MNPAEKIPPEFAKFVRGQLASVADKLFLSWDTPDVYAFVREVTPDLSSIVNRVEEAVAERFGAPAFTVHLVAHQGRPTPEDYYGCVRLK